MADSRYLERNTQEEFGAFYHTRELGSSQKLHIKRTKVRD